LASPRASHYRPLLVLVIFLACWWLAPVVVRRFTRTSFSLFEAPGWSAYSRLKDLQDFWTLRAHSQAELIEAGRDATHQANAASLQVQEDESLRQENDRLAELLKLGPAPEFHYQMARVVQRDETAWWQQIMIDKGWSDGLAPDQGVVFAGGVVGRVAHQPERLLPHQAWVELITSPSFRVDASLGRNPNPVIFQGVETAPFHSPTGEARNVSMAFTLPDGSPLPLVTSNYGGAFPAGLLIGMVDNLASGDDGVSQTGVVKLDPRLSNLYEVAVLVPESPSPESPARQTTAIVPPALPKPAATTTRRPGQTR